MKKVPTTKQKNTNTKPFPSAWDLFRPSMAVLKRNITTFITIVTLPFILMLAGGIIATVTDFQEYVKAVGTVIGISLICGGIVMSVLAFPSVYYIQLQGTKDEIVPFGEAFAAGREFVWRIIGLNILTSLIYSVALILFIVPFFFALKRYILAPYYLIDQDLSIMEALKQSSEDSSTYSEPIWGVIGVQTLITVSGYIPFLGLLALLPGLLYVCAPSVRYTEIQRAKQRGDKKQASRLSKNAAAISYTP